MKIVFIPSPGARVLGRQKWRKHFEDHDDGRTTVKNDTISYGDPPKFLFLRFFQIFYTKMFHQTFFNIFTFLLH